MNAGRSAAWASAWMPRPAPSPSGYIATPPAQLGVAQLLADELLGLRVLEQALGQRLVDVRALHAPVVVADRELVAVLRDVDVRRDGDGLVVGLGEVAGR